MNGWKKSAFNMLLFIISGWAGLVSANRITASNADYKTYLTGLQPGDTLILSAGSYTGDLTLNNVNGSASKPIVITGIPGGSTVFTARSCCNTVSLTMCSYLVIQHLKLNGNNEFVDAVKAEGTIGNQVHHITVQYLQIVGYGVDQQAVGISTKCHAWNWVIRKNIIDGAGTGLYLGNSNGDAPFVNGLIEYNLVKNTVGYNMEIKHQLDTVRKRYAGTNVDGKTIIRYNVFSKEQNASTGANARPNVLLGAFPGTGAGASDVYEVYGNFFWQNPVETMLQITGNTALYNNIFVNHSDGGGMRAVYITSQNGFSPRNISVFHNTIWAANSAGGIRLFNPNTSFKQYCYGNAVFATNAISNFTDSLHNITDAYTNAVNYLKNPVANLAQLDLYPLAGKLTGANTSNTLFQNFSDYTKDFNATTYNWNYRGAFSGSGTNPGWKLQLDTMPDKIVGVNAVRNIEAKPLWNFQNPAKNQLVFSGIKQSLHIEILDMQGRRVKIFQIQPDYPVVDISELKNGLFLVRETNSFNKPEWLMIAEN